MQVKNNKMNEATLKLLNATLATQQALLRLVMKIDQLISDHEAPSETIQPSAATN